METRRGFLRKMTAAGLMLAFSRARVARPLPPPKGGREADCTLFRAVNGTPADNMHTVLDLMGGIEKLIGPDAVVLIKPNVQWWNQGAPNLAALKTFVDCVMDRPGGFSGEVVLRPMMYVALSYDHRIVDGREAVTFLLRVKERIESPSRILLEV